MSDWVLVANHAQARLYALQGDEGLDELEHFVNRHAAVDVRLPARVPDHARPDRAFAARIAEALEAARAARLFSGLVLVAPSPFLDTLCAQLGSALRNRVMAKVDRDLTLRPAPWIRALLPLRKKPERSGARPSAHPAA